MCTLHHAQREHEQQADDAHHHGAALEQRDVGEQELEHVQEEIACGGGGARERTDDDEVRDAGAAGVEQHDEGDDETVRLSQHVLRVSGARRQDSSHLSVGILVCDAAGTCDDNLRQAGNGREGNQKDDAGDERALR